ncbi:SIFamide-related peptide [Cylas formicarius]|uniref:SIFamide-related peptide n=1 Tax=Cylas formicarius TaxID=197179 RepID=UPI0029584EA2|nr:SIFamide-related peptide [Cylas formicarius]
MKFANSQFVAILIVLSVLFYMFSVTEATYRKPPFNGSIFGKRSGLNTEYEAASKALSAMCEIANDACQSWFPSQEK